MFSGLTMVHSTFLRIGRFKSDARRTNAFSRRHVFGAVLLNLYKLSSIQYNPIAWAMEDVDFNNRTDELSSVRIDEGVLVKYLRLIAHKKFINEGGVIPEDPQVEIRHLKNVITEKDKTIEEKNKTIEEKDKMIEELLRKNKKLEEDKNIQEMQVKEFTSNVEIVQKEEWEGNKMANKSEKGDFNTKRGTSMKRFIDNNGCIHCTSGGDIDERKRKQKIGKNGHPREK